MVTKLITAGYNIKFRENDLFVWRWDRTVYSSEIYSLFPELYQGEAYNYNSGVWIVRFS